MEGGSHSPLGDCVLRGRRGGGGDVVCLTAGDRRDCGNNGGMKVRDLQKLGGGGEGEGGCRCLYLIGNDSIWMGGGGVISCSMHIQCIETCFTYIYHLLRVGCHRYQCN